MLEPRCSSFTRQWLIVGVHFAQGEVIIYELPGMLVPATAQTLVGKRVAR